jgi:hypothetical protein
MVAVGFLFGIVYANIIEYAVHRYLFHGLGKKKNSVFAFHIRSHHLTARKNKFIDRKVSLVELIGLPIVLAIHLPVWFIAPTIFYGLSAYALAFVILHNYQHRHPEFTKKYFPWHWNHHMKNQNKSWGVVLPLTDVLTGTLEK